MTCSASTMVARLGAAALIVLTAGCGSDSSSDDASATPTGCAVASEKSLQAALGTDELTSVGSATPDADTGLIECATNDPISSGVFALVEVRDASASDLSARDGWRGDAPTAGDGCKEPTFVNEGDLGGVACVEQSSEGEATRLQVVSPTQVIVVTLSMAADANSGDVDSALAIARSVEDTLSDEA